MAGDEPVLALDSREWWLEPIDPRLRDTAMAAVQRGDAVGFLCCDNIQSLDLVAGNLQRLRAIGLYEAALLSAFTATRTNNLRWPMGELLWLFDTADRARLRVAGDALPGPGPFSLYRGVAGRWPGRRVRGLSWTGSLERAQWFASRFSLEHPAVYRATVSDDHVLAYVNDRNEQEFIVRLPSSVRPKRMPDVTSEPTC